jgi:hypothetical protein
VMIGKVLIYEHIACSPTVNQGMGGNIVVLEGQVHVMIRWYLSIDPSSMATSFTVMLEIENDFANIGDNTGELLGRGPSSCSWLIHFLTGRWG